MPAARSVSSSLARAARGTGRAETSRPGSRCRTWLAPVLLAAFCFWQAVPEPRSIVPEASAAVSTGAPPRSASADGLGAPVAAERRLLTRPIEEIRVGQRVLAENPELAGLRLPDTPIDPETWRTVELRMTKPDGSGLDVALLRPLEWLVFTGAAPGAVIELDLEELGAAGPAEVLRISPCPPIETGPGRVVTGTFAHSAANVIDLHISGLDEPIGVTENHPFWSEDRQAFVPAAGLRVGERMHTLHDEPSRVASMTRRGPPEAVYNIEVDAEHTYFVSQSGIPVHNHCIRLNHRNGIAAQKRFANDLRANGFHVVGENITFRTPFGRRVADIVIKQNGKYHGIEVKSGGAVRSASQFAKDRFINTHTAAAVGAKAHNAKIDFLESMVTVHVP